MNILCATDLLPKSESAIDRAGILAAQLGAELSLLHVVPTTELPEMAAQDLERAKVQLEARVTPPLWRFGPLPNVLLRKGNPTRELIEAVRQAKPDLIVLGRHHPRPLRDFLTGTIAARLLSERKCPVLIVDSLALGAYRKVVLALDRTQASAETVRVAEATVLNNGAGAAIIHAYPPAYDGTLSGAGTTATLLLRALLMGVTDNVSRYELIIEHATPAAAIRKAVRRLNADLLVLGTRRRGRFGHALLGGIANLAVARVHCDVLVMPDPVSARPRPKRIG